MVAYVCEREREGERRRGREGKKERGRERGERERDISKTKSLTTNLPCADVILILVLLCGGTC